MGKLRDEILGPRISKKRSPLLSRACHRMLVTAARAYPEHTIDRYKPGGVWIDLERFSVSTLRQALEYCLVHSDGVAGTCTYYALNSCGYAILADPNYKPEIMRHLSDAQRAYASVFMSV